MVKKIVDSFKQKDKLLFYETNKERYYDYVIFVLVKSRFFALYENISLLSVCGKINKINLPQKFAFF